MASVLVGARLLLVAVFATAGVAKLFDREGSRRALAGFGVPAAAIPVAAILLPLAELATAVALVPPTSARWGGLSALILLLAFSAGITHAIRQGRAPDCHCFGQLHSAPAGRRTLNRNLALAAPAALVAVEGPGPSLSAWVGDRTAAELVAIATGLAAIVLGSYAFRFRRENGALRRRLNDILSELEDRPRGLPVGALAPDFSVRSVHGPTVTLPALRARDRPILMLFVSPGCGPCKEVFDDVARWQATLADDLTVAVISSGTPAENLAAVGDRSADVLLEDDWEVTKAYKVLATPSAVVVSPQGRIASAVVPGTAIESLIRLTVRDHATGPSPSEPSPAVPVG